MSEENTVPLPAVGSRTYLLSLPYDIRHTIYKHLFPNEQIIYLKASKDRLASMMRPGELPMNLGLSCRQLHNEANEYLYNNYPINIIGYKKYCVAHFQPIHTLAQKFAKKGSCLQVLDNGELSTTACVSIYPRGGRVEDMMRRRKQGKPRDLREVKREALRMPDMDDDRRFDFGESSVRFDTQVLYCLGMVNEGLAMLCTPGGFAAILVVGVAIYIAKFHDWELLVEERWRAGER